MATRKMPERIRDTPENIALACMQGPPKKDWDYLKKRKGLKVGRKQKRDSIGGK